MLGPWGRPGKQSRPTEAANVCFKTNPLPAPIRPSQGLLSCPCNPPLSPWKRVKTWNVQADFWQPSAICLEKCQRVCYPIFSCLNLNGSFWQLFHRLFTSEILETYLMISLCLHADQVIQSPMAKKLSKQSDSYRVCFSFCQNAGPHWCRPKFNFTEPYRMRGLETLHSSLNIKTYFFIQTTAVQRILSETIPLHFLKELLAQTLILHTKGFHALWKLAFFLRFGHSLTEGDLHISFISEWQSKECQIRYKYLFHTRVWVQQLNLLLWEEAIKCVGLFLKSLLHEMVPNLVGY